MPGPQRCSHIDQWLESPADGQPDHGGQQQAPQDIGPQCVAYDAVHQVHSHVFPFAHPDAQVVLLVYKQEGTPMPVVQVDYIAETWCDRGCAEGRRTGRMYQHFVPGVPDLKRNFRFIRMPLAPGRRLVQGLVESLVQIRVFLAHHGHTHDAL
ncbi:hypothetical protein D9M69_536890 [compost metagenome]